MEIVDDIKKHTIIWVTKEDRLAIIIDDISNPEKFHQLSDLAYSCLHKEHRQLSEIL